MDSKMVRDIWNLSKGEDQINSWALMEILQTLLNKVEQLEAQIEQLRIKEDYK